MTQKQQQIEELLRNMGKMRRMFEACIHEFCEVPGMTTMQYSALKYLAYHRGASVGDVGEFLHLSKSSTTQLIERLVRAGYAEREERSDDRRSVRILVTAIGREVVAKMKDRYVKKLTKQLADLNEQDVSEYLRIQRIIINSLEQN